MSAQVRATGVGIPADLQSRIGEVLEQVSNVPKLAREGTGLGLALVRAPSSQNTEIICIESRSDIGTKVSVNMPRAQPDRAAFAISTRPMPGLQVTS